MNSSSDFTITTPFPPPVDDEQRLLRQGKSVVEKLDSMDDGRKVEVGNNEFLGICDGIEFGATISDREELDNAEYRDERSVEKRRWKA